MWAAAVRPDERNRVRLAMRPLLVRGVRTLLIDAGIGDKESGTFHELYGVDRARHLDHALAEAGVAPDEIDIVLATHLHFDHAGGFTVRDAAGRLRPRFPRARYVARRGEWEEAGHPHERNRGSYRAEISCRWPRPGCWSSWTRTRRSCRASACDARAATLCITRSC